MDPIPGFRTRREPRTLERVPSTTNLQYLGLSLAGADATSSVPGSSATTPRSSREEVTKQTRNREYRLEAIDTTKGYVMQGGAKEEIQ